MVDELEEFVEGGNKIPLTGKVILDSDTLLEYIDRIRTILPDELRQAKWVSKEKERMLKEAQAEADHIIDEAHQQLKRTASENEIVKQATIMADGIVNQAKSSAKEMKSGASSYAEDILKQLEGNLEKAIAITKKGRDELKLSRSKNQI